MVHTRHRSTWRTSLSGSCATWDDDDGFELYESRAIARYVAAKYGPAQGVHLLPPASDLKATAKFDQALLSEMANFYAGAEVIVYELYLKLLAKRGETDLKRVEEAKLSFQAKRDAYGVILSTQPYLAGDTLTIVNFMHLPHGELLTEGCKLDYLVSPKGGGKRFHLGLRGSA